MTTIQTTAIPTRLAPRPRARTYAGRSRASSSRKRRSQWQLPATSRVAAAGARLDARIKVYAAGAAVLVLVILYVAQSAQVTAASYRIEQLQSQQQDLLAERAQLRYEEASLQAPARVQVDAARSGLQRVSPAGYLPYRRSGADLARALDESPAEPAPGWQRMLAALWGGGPS